jgi:hypothetical protein
MGEIEETLEQLNKILADAGFPKVRLHGLNKHENIWAMHIGTCLQFDKDGKYIMPDEAGEYA